MIPRRRKTAIEVAVGKAFLECVNMPNDAVYLAEYANKIAKEYADEFRGSSVTHDSNPKETATVK